MISSSLRSGAVQTGLHRLDESTPKRTRLLTNYDLLPIAMWESVLRDQREPCPIVRIEHEQRRDLRHAHHDREPIDGTSGAVGNLLRAIPANAREEHQERIAAQLLETSGVDV
jgi:hypothetical protein